MTDSVLNTIDSILEEFEEMDEYERAGPPLDNTRYEIFAVHLASGHNESNSYRIAFGIEKDKAVGSRPAKLVQRAAVRKRVAALCHQRAEMVLARSILTERNILDEYAWGVKNTREAGKFKDHKGYLDSVSKIFGLFADSDKKTDNANKSLEDLRAETALLLKESGIPIPESASNE